MSLLTFVNILSDNFYFYSLKKYCIIILDHILAYTNICIYISIYAFIYVNKYMCTYKSNPHVLTNKNKCIGYNMHARAQMHVNEHNLQKIYSLTKTHLTTHMQQHTCKNMDKYALTHTNMWMTKKRKRPNKHAPTCTH